MTQAGFAPPSWVTSTWLRPNRWLLAGNPAAPQKSKTPLLRAAFRSPIARAVTQRCRHEGLSQSMYAVKRTPYWRGVLKNRRLRSGLLMIAVIHDASVKLLTKASRRKAPLCGA